MLRRLKRDVIKELPTKSEQILRIEMAAMQVRLAQGQGEFDAHTAQITYYKNILTRVRKTCTCL
jgi:SNF2 family DNA or RNA helicase